MFENLKMGWRLGKQVRKLVFSNKGLLIYPIMSVIAVAIEAFIIALSFLFAAASPITGVLALVAIYLVTTFTATYVLVAMLLAFRSYANGKRIGLGEAFGQASQYATLIIEWSLFYTVILMIVRLIASMFGRVGSLVIGAIAGIGLAVATAFVIPVIIDDKVGPVEAMKRSATFFVTNFGKTVGGIIYADLYNLRFVLLGLGMVFLGIILLAGTGVGAGGVAAAVLLILGALLFVFGILMNSLMINVYKLILYDYIKTGKLPNGIDKSLVNQTIDAAKNRRQPFNIQ